MAHETHRSSFDKHNPLKGHRDPARLLRGNSRQPEACFERDHTYSYRPKQELGMPSERRDERHRKSDRCYSSNHDTIPEKRSSRGAQPSADQGQGYTNSANARPSQRSSSHPMEAATLAYREPTAATSHRGTIIVVMRGRIIAQATICGKEIPGAIEEIHLISCQNQSHKLETICRIFTPY